MNRRNSSDSYLQELIRGIESGDIELNPASVRVIQRYGRHPAEFFTWIELGDALTPKEMLDLGLMPKNVYRQVVKLQDESWDARSDAAETLGDTGDSSAIPSLIPLLEDENANVRFRAAEALGKIGDPSAILALIPLLQDQYDENWYVRYNATESLRKLGYES